MKRGGKLRSIKISGKINASKRMGLCLASSELSSESTVRLGNDEEKKGYGTED